MNSLVKRADIGVAVSLLCVLGCLSCKPATAARSKPKVAKRAAVLAEDDSPAHPLLRDTANIAEGAGAGELQAIARSPLRIGETVDGFVYLPAHRCALVYARAADSVVDLDLHAFADDGTQFGADEAPDDLPTLMLCGGKIGQRLLVSAKVAQGQGLVALGMHDVAPELRGQVAQSVGARERLSKFDAEEEVWPSLQADITEHLRAVGGSWTDLRRVAVPVDARMPTRLDAEIPKNTCLDVLAVPDDRYLQLDMVVFDAEDRILSRGEEVGGERYAIICSGNDMSLVHVELRPQSGQGLILVALSLSQNEGIELDFPSGLGVIRTTSALEVPRLRNEVVLQSRKIDLELGRLGIYDFDSRGCQRYFLRAASGSRSFGVAMRAYDPRGRLLGELPALGPQPLTACHQGKVRLELDPSADAKNAELTVTRSPWPMRNWTKAPLSASRALLRAQSVHGSLSNLTLRESTPIELTDTELRRVPLGGDEPGCFTYALGVEEASGWLELRLVAADGEVLRRAQGRHSTGLSYCGTQGPVSGVQIRREGPPTDGYVVRFFESSSPQRAPQ